MPKKRAPPIADERQQLVVSSIVTLTYKDGRTSTFPAIRGFKDERVIAAKAAGAKAKFRVKLGDPID